MINEITAPMMNDNFGTKSDVILNNDEVIAKLNGLIETCKDGQEGFKQSAETVQSSNLKTTFYEFSQQRAQFVGELQELVRELGGNPEHSGSFVGALHRGWMDLKTVIMGQDEAAILNEAERGEDIAKSNYKDAVEQILPANVLSLVNRQYEAIKYAHDKVKALRDSANIKHSSATTGN